MFTAEVFTKRTLYTAKFNTREEAASYVSQVLRFDFYMWEFDGDSITGRIIEKNLFGGDDKVIGAIEGAIYEGDFRATDHAFEIRNTRNDPATVIIEGVARFLANDNGVKTDHALSEVNNQHLRAAMNEYRQRKARL